MKTLNQSAHGNILPGDNFGFVTVLCLCLSHKRKVLKLFFLHLWEKTYILEKRWYQKKMFSPALCRMAC